MSRLIVVSNRLPVTVARDGDALSVRPSTGGLATGLSGPHAHSEGLWIGWPGPTWDLHPAERERLDLALRERRLEPVHLTQEEVEQFYESFANGVLWPLFHYQVDQIPLRVEGWDAYVDVNARYADLVARAWRPGDVVWVHDYQLLLLPRMLRERVPDARIGFFLHIPFPSSAVLRALPHREELLQGLLGADLIGFHTPAYLRHFAAALLSVLGIDVHVDRVVHGGREVVLGSFPMGVDAAEFARLGDDADVQRRAAEVRGSDECRLLVGIDRLDYTKGIVRRLLAYEELLSANSDLRGRVRLLQVAVPSRGSVPAYQDVRQLIEEHVGRITGRFATPTWMPVHHLHRSLAREEVAALYRAADVLLVTPIRDGMNLVAKEFVAARTDEDGVLVLSEFAGAASELDGALLVNPFDVGHTARVFRAALDLSRDARRERMRTLRARVMRADVHQWADRFLAALGAASAAQIPTRPSASDEIERALARAARSEELVLLLDYDGTLVPFAPTPAEAAPDAELLDLLGQLSECRGLSAHLVSGRPREDLERWFGALPIGLHAEHGLWSRAAGDGPWRRAPASELPCAERIAAILEDWSERTPGAFVERKSAVLVWHWRRADPEHGRLQASELRLHLAQMLSNEGVEILVGNHIVEVRPHGVHKGNVIAAATATSSPDALVLAMGDDRTDEDLFAALAPGHVAVHVGPRESRAALRLADPAAARAFLSALLERRQASAAPRRGR